MLKSRYNKNTMASFQMPNIFESNIRDTSAEPQPAKRKLDSVWDKLNEALDVVGPCGSTSMASSLEPVPIHPHGMEIVDEIHLESTWDQSDPNTDALKWVLAMQETPVVSADQFGPLVACSDGGSEASHGIVTSRSIGAPAPLNIALLKSEKWDERFQELLQFREEYGHCLVPHNWAGNKELAQWVKRQRYQFKLRCDGQRNMLTDDRFQALEEVDFVWSSHHANWDDKFQELKDFSERHGHCNVPSRYAHNRQLSIWVRSQRRQYKLLGRAQGGKPASHMTEERFHKLLSLGFQFNPRQRDV
jgi:hypothetical protein